jgi:Uma2 family endonuclease
VRPLLRREYEQLVELGAFEDERVELLRGVLVEMSPQGEPHARISAWFAQHLIKALDIERYDVRTHSPFAATDDSMPEPDVSISPRSAVYAPPSKALLLIEVTGSSATKDRVIKREIYAEAGVPEYWIVDLAEKTVDVLTRPGPAGYAKVARFAPGDVLRPRKLPRVTIPVAAVPWPPRGTERSRRKVAKRRRRARG